MDYIDTFSVYKLNISNIWCNNDIINPDNEQPIVKLDEISRELNSSIISLESNAFFNDPLINQFDLYKNLIEFYQNRKNAEGVSNKWLSCYELISSQKVFNGLKSINCLFSDDIYGSYMLATLHYCHTHNIQINWLANNYIMNRNYDLLNTNNLLYTDNSHKWIMDSEFDGNITNPLHLKLARLKVQTKLKKPVDLFVGNVYGNAIVDLSNVFLGLFTLSGSGTMIITIENILNPLGISILLLLSNLFKELHIVKNSTTPINRLAISIIGKDFYGLNKLIEDRLISILKTYQSIPRDKRIEYPFYIYSPRVQPQIIELIDILKEIYISKQKNKIDHILSQSDKKSREEIIQILKNMIIIHRDKYIYLNNIKKINTKHSVLLKSSLSKQSIDLSNIKKAGSKYFIDAFSRDASSRLQQTVIQTINKSFDYKNPQQRRYSEKLISDLKKIVVSEQLFDNEVYNYIHQELNTNYYPFYGFPNNESIDRADSRIKTIQKMLDSIRYKPEVYVDYGCSEGCITSTMAEVLQLSKDNVYAFDIKEPKNLKNIQFIQLSKDNSNIPLESEKVDFITCLMVLHHIMEPINQIREFFRILKKGGILIIREHDIDSSTDRDAHKFLDILHGLYSISWAKTGNQEDPNYLENNFANYHNREFWDNMIESNGFKRLQNTDLDYEYNISKVDRDYQSSKKIKNQYYAYWAIYQKI
jgi:ubiquinone/menaquinone biosynthesis C-methylase UbiE